MTLPPPARRSLLPVLAVLTAAAWLAFAFSGQDAVLGSGPVRDVLRIAAIVCTALLAVAALGAIVLSRALRGAEGEPTGFLRVIVYGVLTFVATFVTLRYFGFDVRAVLATSAIATAAVGFAMQPTLGSMISGLTLHMDRVMRVGDGIMHEKEWVEIVSLNWRTATGRTTSGRTLVFPNAKLSDSILEILPHDQPLEAVFHFLAPIAVRPEWITELTNELMVDLPLVEESLPILVAPVGYDPANGALRYRVKFWIRRYGAWDDVEAEAHRRLWYVFQRNRIPYPVQHKWEVGPGEAPPQADARLPALHLEGLPEAEVARLAAAALPSELTGEERAQAGAALARRGALLLFAADEFLVMPEWTEGSSYLLIRGEAEASQALKTLQEAESSPAYLMQQLGRTAAVKRVADELAHYIGPYAEYAVNRAAEHTTDLDTLCREAAEEIANPKDRLAFLSKVIPGEGVAIRPGAVLSAKRNAAGSLILGGGLRAQRELAILALPPRP